MIFTIDHKMKSAGLIYGISNDTKPHTYFCKGFKNVKGRQQLRNVLYFFSHEMLKCHRKLPDALFLLFSQFANVFVKEKINSTIAQ